ncbi:MAG: LytR C-terminal domain-containing protein [Acidimicrobiales bacterium]
MNDRRRGPAYRGAGGGAGGPAGQGNAGARGALLLAVAVILGIVLLQQFDSDIDTGGQVATDASQTDDETSTTGAVGLTTVPAAPSTTVAARPKSEVRVLVANGAGVRGLGAATTTVLRNLGYATLTPTDATTGVDKTAVHFAEGYATEAREVAGALSLPATAAIPVASPPVAAADLGDAKVIVVLGTDVSTSTTTAPAGGAGTTSTTRR